MILKMMKTRISSMISKTLETNSFQTLDPEATATEELKKQRLSNLISRLLKRVMTVLRHRM